MSWKRTDLERLKAASLTDQLKKSSIPERYGPGSQLLSRKEQREKERAQGLVPFAVKLPSELVARVQARAKDTGQPLGDVVADLLGKGLDASR